MKERLISLVTDAFKNFINRYRLKQEFSAAGEEILMLEHDKESELYSQLEVMFSKENMIHLFSTIEECNGSEYINVVKREMRKVFGDYEIEVKARENYIDFFLSILLNRIESMDPKLFQLISLDEIKQKLDKTFESIKNMKEDISVLINDIGNFDFSKEEIYSMEEENFFIMRNTNPQINLSFYDYENSVFKNDLLSQLDREVVYVQGETLEEAVYCIVNILRECKDEYNYKKVYLIKSKDTWEKINGTIWNSILIPFFYSDDISMISGNTVIFVRGKEELEKKDTLHLGKRTRRNLYDMLRKCEVESEYSNRIVSDSNVVYSSIKRMLFVGNFQKPKWYFDMDDKGLLIPALLFGMWTNKEGDIDVFESYLTYDFTKYERLLSKVINTSDPYIMKYTLRSRVYYKIANIEEAWQLLGHLVSKEQAISFLEMARYLLYDIKPKFDLPQEDHYYSSVLGYDSDFTDDVRNGIQRTLILMNKYASDEIKFQVNNCIVDILSETNSEKEWFALSEYFDILIEAAPENLLMRIEDEIDTENSNLFKIFEKNGGGGIFSRDYYVHILWGLEKLLFINQYVPRVINVLVNLNSKNYEFGTSKSPKETLTRIFCAWQHEINISIEEKKQIFGYLLENDSLDFELIKDIIPHRSMNGTYSPLCKPKYISYVISDELKYKHQIIETYLFYMESFIDYAKNDFDQWLILFDDCFFIDMGLTDSVIKITTEMLNRNEDGSKYRLCTKLRTFIYRHRFYKDANWSLTEDKIKVLYDFFMSITFEDKMYKYVFLFDDYHVALIDPIPYQEEDHMILNNEKVNLLRVEFMKSLDQLEVNIYKLIALTRENNGDIGSYIAEYYHKGVLDWTFVLRIENMMRNQILKQYFSTMQEMGTNLLSSFNNKSDEININSKTINTMLQVIKLNDLTLTDLDRLPEPIQSSYWKSYSSYYIIKNKIILRKVLDSLYKYENYIAALEIIHYELKVDATEHIYVLKGLIEASNKQSDIARNMTHELYLIQKSLELIYQNQDKLQYLSDDIIQIEIYFMKVLDRNFELKFITRKLSREPSFFAELIAYSYKTDEGELLYKSTNEIDGTIRIASSLLRDVKFCPSTINGEITITDLEKYINEFMMIMKRQMQVAIGNKLLGEKLSNSLEDENGFYPPESICKMIEKHYTKDLERGFYKGVLNSRGVFSGSEGMNELTLSRKFEAYSKKCSVKYPRTASILMGISIRYKWDSDEDRRSAEYEF